MKPNSSKPSNITRARSGAWYLLPVFQTHKDTNTFYPNRPTAMSTIANTPRKHASTLASCRYRVVSNRACLTPWMIPVVLTTTRPLMPAHSTHAYIHMCVVTITRSSFIQTNSQPIRVQTITIIISLKNSRCNNKQ
jgi:hypothetical protein